MMRLDNECQWTQGFEEAFSIALELSGKVFSHDEIISLAHRVGHLYQGGMGSFNDYVPRIYQKDTGRYLVIPGSQEFEKVQGKVAKLAFELRVIGKT